MNRQEVAQGFGWNVLFTFANKLFLPLAVTVAIYRKLGPAELGLFATLSAIVAVTDIFRDAGLGHTYIADQEATGRKERQYAGLALAMALALAGLVLGFRQVIAVQLGEPEIAWGLQMISLTMVISGIVSIPYSRLQKEARFRESGIVDTTANLVSYAIALALVFGGLGFEGLVWQVVSRGVLHLVLVWRLAGVWPAMPDAGFLRSVLGKSTSLLVQNVLYTLYTLGDQIVVARLLGKEAVGLYNAAKNLAIKPLDFVSFPLGRTLFVAFSRASGDRERFTSVFYRSLAATSMVTVPLFVALGVFAGPIVRLLFGEAFVGSIVPLQWFCLYFGCRSIGTLAGSALVAAGKPLMNVFPWLAGYAVAGIGVWSETDRSLNAVSGWIAAGAVTVYALYLVTAAIVFRPKAEDWARLRSAWLPVTASSGFAALWPLVEVPPAVAVLVLLPSVAVFHVLMLGSVILRRPTAGFTPAGAKALWHSL